MPDPGPEMIRNRPRDAKLQHPLRHAAEATEPFRHGARLQVPPQQRGRQVRRREDVHAAREHAAGDAVERGPVPGDLGAVDGKVRGDGAVQTLGGEDGVGGGWRGRLRLGGRFRGGGLECDMPVNFKNKGGPSLAAFGSGVPTGFEREIERARRDI